MRQNWLCEREKKLLATNARLNFLEKTPISLHHCNPSRECKTWRFGECFAVVGMAPKTCIRPRCYLQSATLKARPEDILGQLIIGSVCISRTVKNRRRIFIVTSVSRTKTLSNWRSLISIYLDQPDWLNSF